VSRATLAALLLLAPGLSACGNDAPELIDTGKIERGIEADVEAKRPKVDVESVKCPGNVELKKGDVFKCLVTSTDGEQVEATVTQVDDKGRVRYVIP
jgi:hypothetical protein